MIQYTLIWTTVTLYSHYNQTFSYIVLSGDFYPFWQHTTPKRS